MFVAPPPRPLAWTVGLVGLFAVVVGDTGCWRANLYAITDPPARDGSAGYDGAILVFPGNVTHALYWEDRPYTLYVWDLGSRGGRLFYFNIADRVALGREEFVWRDLALDILIDDAGGIDILDKHELPPDVAPELRLYIDEAVDLVVKQHRDIIREASERIERQVR